MKPESGLRQSTIPKMLAKPVPKRSMTSQNRSKPDFNLFDDDSWETQDEEVEVDQGRCVCRAGRSERAPPQNEFRIVFQEGLDVITDNSNHRLDVFHHHHPFQGTTLSSQIGSQTVDTSSPQTHQAQES